MSKGVSELASVLQRRMSNVSKKSAGHGVTVEMGEIVQGNKLKLYSIPGAILGSGDYSVCEGIYKRNELKCEENTRDYKLKTGDKVLVVWTFDGEPVVIDKIV